MRGDKQIPDTEWYLFDTKYSSSTWAISVKNLTNICFYAWWSYCIERRYNDARYVLTTAFVAAAAESAKQAVSKTSVEKGKDRKQLQGRKIKGED
jgi:hypothetical protein